MKKQQSRNVSKLMYGDKSALCFQFSKPQAKRFQATAPVSPKLKSYDSSTRVHIYDLHRTQWTEAQCFYCPTVRVIRCKYK